MMTVTQTKVTGFLFVTYRSARAVASKYGAFRISKSTVQLLNLFLNEMVHVLVKASADYRLCHTALPGVLRRLCPHGSLAVNAIAHGESLLGRVSLKNDPRGFPQGQLPLTTVVERVLAQCSAYSVMGNSSSFVPKSHALITSRTAALLCGIIEHVATFLIVDAILLARNTQLEYVDSKTFQNAIEINKEIRGIYTRSNLMNAMESNRAKHFGPKPERLTDSSLDSESIDSLSDFDCDDDTSSRSSDESSPGRDRSTFAKIFGGFRSNRPKGISIPSNFPSPRSSMEDLIFGGRQSPKTSLFKSGDLGTSPLGPQSPELIRTKSNSSLLINPEKAKNFEALIKSTETLKISLTSSRLQTIEVKASNKPRLVPRDEGNINSRGNLIQIMQELGEPPVKV